MKKIFLYSAVLFLGLTSCRKDTTTATYTEPENIETQNSYDDQAIQKFLENNYLDALGNIKPFSSTDTSDDNYPKLSSYNPVKLPSGVVYIVTPNSQPTVGTGTTIGATDIIRFMNRTYGYIANSTDSGVQFISPTLFRSTIDGSGVPEVDPAYYYAKKSLITDATPHSYYEIEGLREGLQHFQAFNIPDSDAYKLQGIIIVPSRAAFARDNHYAYNGVNWRNRTFVFNFQVYKTTLRPDN